MLTLLAGRSLTLRPLRTFLTALGIAVAVGSMVIFLSLGEGLRQVFGEQLGSVGPDLQVSFGPFDAGSPLTSLPELPLEYKERLEGASERYGIESVTPLLFHLRSGITPTSAFAFQGYPTEVDIGSIYYGTRITAGRGLTAADAGRDVAVVGEQLAKRNRLELGDELRLNPRQRFEIVGLAASDSGIVDNAVLVPIASLQEAIGIPDRVSYFALELRESAAAAATAEKLSAEFPELGFQTRGDVLSVLEQGLQVSDFVRLGISAIALIVGAIAVANTMMMNVFERTREFGVVRAIGARPAFLFRLVLLEAVLLSLVGAFAGLLLGRFGVAVVNHYSLQFVGLEVAVLSVRLALFAVVVALLLGLLSGLVPAVRAARIPVAVAMARE